MRLHAKESIARWQEMCRAESQEMPDGLKTCDFAPVNEAPSCGGLTANAFRSRQEQPLEGKALSRFRHLALFPTQQGLVSSRAGK